MQEIAKRVLNLPDGPLHDRDKVATYKEAPVGLVFEAWASVQHHPHVLFYQGVGLGDKGVDVGEREWSEVGVVALVRV